MLVVVIAAALVSHTSRMLLGEPAARPGDRRRPRTAAAHPDRRDRRRALWRLVAAWRCGVSDHPRPADGAARAGRRTSPERAMTTATPVTAVG